MCGSCGDEAARRCMACLGVYYCSRRCQMSDWAQHKPTCVRRVEEAMDSEAAGVGVVNLDTNGWGNREEARGGRSREAEGGEADDDAMRIRTEADIVTAIVDDDGSRPEPSVAAAVAVAAMTSDASAMAPAGNASGEPPSGTGGGDLGSVDRIDRTIGASLDGTLRSYAEAMLRQVGGSLEATQGAQYLRLVRHARYPGFDGFGFLCSTSVFFFFLFFLFYVIVARVF